jgi:hypothetical protein
LHDANLLRTTAVRAMAGNPCYTTRAPFAAVITHNSTSQFTAAIIHTMLHSTDASFSQPAFTTETGSLVRFHSQLQQFTPPHPIHIWSHSDRSLPIHRGAHSHPPPPPPHAQVKDALDCGVRPVLVHEQGAGFVSFRELIELTPRLLVAPPYKLYDTPAVPWYSTPEHGLVSKRQVRPCPPLPLSLLYLQASRAHIAPLRQYPRTLSLPVPAPTFITRTCTARRMGASTRPPGPRLVHTSRSPPDSHRKTSAAVPRTHTKGTLPLPSFQVLYAIRLASSAARSDRSALFAWAQRILGFAPAQSISRVGLRRDHSEVGAAEGSLSRILFGRSFSTKFSRSFSRSSKL